MTTTDYQFAASDIRADKDIYGVADLSPDSVTHSVMTLDGPARPVAARLQ